MTNPRHDRVGAMFSQVLSLRREAETMFLGLSARFLNGKYEGRWGIVKAVMISDLEGVTLMVQPYAMTIVNPETGLPSGIVGEGDLLWQHRDARSYRPVAEYGWVDDYEACRACQRRVASPCHDVGSFHENGPWDGMCRDVFTRPVTIATEDFREHQGLPTGRAS